MQAATLDYKLKEYTELLQVRKGVDRWLGELSKKDQLSGQNSVDAKF